MSTKLASHNRLFKALSAFVLLLLLLILPTLVVNASTTYRLYNDLLENGWVDWGWDGTRNFGATVAPYSGTKHVLWKPSRAYSGFYLHRDGGINTTGYTHLSFAIRSTQSGNRLAVLAYGSTNTALGPTVYLRDYGGDPVVGSYKLYNIPLSALGAANTQMNGFHLQEQSGTLRSDIYVDQIELVGASSPTATALRPPSTSTPRPGPTATQTPTPMWASTSTPTPPPSGFAYRLYSDQLDNGWVDWGWNGTRNLAATVAPYSGIKHIIWKPSQGGAGFYLHRNGGVNTSGYTYLSFALRSTQSGDRLAVQAYGSTDATLGAALPLQNYGGDPIVGSYKVYNIPLSALGAANTQMNGFHLQDQTGTVRPDLYIDQVELVSTSGPVPTPSSLTRGLLTLTFDDGRKSQITNAWPILQKYGMRGTFYIISQRLDGSYFMTPQDVVTLYNGGNQIGSHTATHPDLTTLSYSQVNYELSQSQRDLQTLLPGAQIRDFATPGGKYNATVLDQIKQYYRSHRTVEGSYNTKSNFDPYRILVKIINNRTTASDVEAWARQAQQDKSWVVIVHHSVEANPDEYSTTPASFDSQLNAIKNTGIAVVTLEQAIDEIVAQR